MVVAQAVPLILGSRRRRSAPVAGHGGLPLVSSAASSGLKEPQAALMGRCVRAGGQARAGGAERGPGLCPGRAAASWPSGLPGGLQGREWPEAAPVMDPLCLLRSCGHGRSAR